MSPTLYYEEGYKYQVSLDYTIRTNLIGYRVSHKFFEFYEDGTLFIRAGYAWDGASGPTIDSRDSIVGSLVHDVFYQMLRLGLLPHIPCFHIANICLRDICRDDGMSELRSAIWFKAVEKFGDANAAIQPDKILTAP